MSIVGPRPHAVAHNEMYRKLIKGYMVRHKVKPGITGWAQVNGYRGETDTLDKMQGRIDYDLDYLRNWSLRLDLYIIYRTIRLVLKDNRLIEATSVSPNGLLSDAVLEMHNCPGSRRAAKPRKSKYWRLGLHDI